MSEKGTASNMWMSAPAASVVLATEHPKLPVATLGGKAGGAEPSAFLEKRMADLSLPIGTIVIALGQRDVVARCSGRERAIAELAS
jgi:hypothetical protein